MFLGVPQLQASFEDRSELHDKDRQVIKDLGLKFRGRQTWPLFRSYRAGFVPWHLDADEGRVEQYRTTMETPASSRGSRRFLFRIGN